MMHGQLTDSACYFKYFDILFVQFSSTYMYICFKTILYSATIRYL